MSRKFVVSVVLIVVFLALGAGTMVLLMETRPEPQRAHMDRPALLVEVVEVQPRTVVESIVGYGTARADRLATISTQVSGEIVDLPDELKTGASFKQGDVLLRIDERDYRQLVAQAQATLDAQRQQLAQLEIEKKNIDELIAIVREQLDIQQAEFHRVASLRERELAHSREYDQQRLQVQILKSQLQQLMNDESLIPTRRAAMEASCARHQAELEIARLNVERCTVRAPFDAEVQDVAVELGERVATGSPLLSLLDPTKLEIPIELPVSVRGRVQAGADCTLSLESSDRSCWRGEVKRISPSADARLRTFELFVEVDNARQEISLMPGSFVKGAIEGPTLTDVLIVPRSCIQQGAVFVYDAGQARRREIVVERTLHEQAVVSGLEPGSLVIVSNLDALYAGAPVRLPENGVASNATRDAALATRPETRLLAEQK